MYKGCANYADGSKMDVGTGLGYYMVNRDIRKSYRLPDEFSVFQVESLAVLKAKEFMTRNTKEGSEIIRRL